MDAQGAAKWISGKALLVVLVLIGGAIGIYARQAMAGPSSFEECMLDEMRGQPLAQSLYGMAEKVCGERFDVSR